MSKRRIGIFTVQTTHGAKCRCGFKVESWSALIFRWLCVSHGIRNHGEHGWTLIAAAKYVLFGVRS